MKLDMFDCKLCHFSSESKTELEIHILSEHSDIFVMKYDLLPPVVNRLRQVCSTGQGTNNEFIDISSKIQKSRTKYDCYNGDLEDKLSSVNLFGVSCTTCQFKATSVQLLEDHENEKHVEMFYKNGSMFGNVCPKRDWCDGLDYSLRDEPKDGFKDESTTKIQTGCKKIDTALDSSETKSEILVSVDSKNPESHPVCHQIIEGKNFVLEASGELTTNESVGRKDEKASRLEIETDNPIAVETDKDNHNHKNAEPNSKESRFSKHTSDVNFTAQISELTNGYSTADQSVTNNNKDQDTSIEGFSNSDLDKQVPDVKTDITHESQDQAQNGVHDAFNFQEEDDVTDIIPFISVFSRNSSKLKSGISGERGSIDSNSNDKQVSALDSSFNYKSVLVSNDPMRLTNKDSSHFIKRKVGRPKKNFNIETPKSDLSGTNLKQTPNLMSTGKRKRGRPKKTLSPAQADSITTPSNLDTTSSISGTIPLGPPSIESSLQTNTVKTAPHQPSTSIPFPPFQTETTLQTEQTLTFHSTAAAEPTKRKRGRPKKNASFGESFTECLELESSLFNIETQNLKTIILSASDAEIAVSSLKIKKKKKKLIEDDHHMGSEAEQLKTSNSKVQKLLHEIGSIANSVDLELEKKQKTIPELLLTDLRFHWEDEDFCATEIIFEKTPNEHSDLEVESTAENENYCEPCKFQALSAVELSRHLMEVHTLEEEKDENVDSLWMLLEAVGKKGCMRCSVCKIKIENFPSLRQHFKGAHKNVTKNNLHKFLERKMTPGQGETFKVCSICGFNAKSSFVLQKHARQVHNIRLNPLSKPGILSNPKEDSIVKPRCIPCNKSFTREQDLVRHRLFTHSNIQQVECKYCQKRFWRNDRLQTHILTVHGVKEQKATNVQATAIIDNCTTETYEDSIFNQDLSKSDNQFPEEFSCTQCGRKYLQQSLLDKHMRFIHPKFSSKQDKLTSKINLQNGNKVKKFPCSYTNCGMKFKCLKNLRFHQSDVHVASRLLSADKDIMEVKTERSVYNIVSPSFTELKYFKEKDNSQTATNGADECKPHKCYKCEKSYTRRHHLKRHYLQTHATRVKFIRKKGGPPGSCDLQEEPVPSMDVNLQQKKEEFQEIVKDLIVNKANGFSCKTCARKFGRHEHLKRHIRLVHLQLKSLKCTLCQDKFSHKYQLDRHLCLKHSKPVDHSDNDLQNPDNKETDLLNKSSSDGTLSLNSSLSSGLNLSHDSLESLVPCGQVLDFQIKIEMEADSDNELEN